MEHYLKKGSVEWKCKDEDVWYPFLTGAFNFEKCDYRIVKSSKNKKKSRITTILSGLF